MKTQIIDIKLRLVDLLKEVIKYQCFPLIFPLYYYFNHKDYSWLKEKNRQARINQGVNNKKIMVIDDRIPYPENGSGYPRTQQILKGLSSLDFKISYYAFIPFVNKDKVERHFNSNIEFITSPLIAKKGALRAIRENLSTIDILLISRPITLKRLYRHLPEFKRQNPNIKIFYDSEAINALRLKGSSQRVNRYLTKELHMASFADKTIAISLRERKVFEQLLQLERLEVLGHQTQEVNISNPIEERSGLLFMGPLYRKSTENSQAFLFFLERIWPYILKNSVTTTFTHIGRNHLIKSHKNLKPNIKLVGEVKDISIYLNKSRVFVAPTLSSSGIPLKLIESGAHGLPSVCSTILANQLGWETEVHALVADDPEEFANQCLRLLTDDELWHKISKNVLQKVKSEYSKGHFTNQLKAIFEPS
ncbi:glycosyltransferase [Roseivirga pacifica]|uniref:glycosyltransferase n=1 Tax=Roseivirga pacifica TaxID=1267423 RepID=UPI00209480B0|nr:glycosyltransferase [Roseivirga pacifica]MCO6359684.1 glycosyltransferase [Roseivirga pacifica]MCO6367054.1 glycosyltransferase [Roseivirga pacifica]MCO6370414.1 glycosyltransferase [Roseivirga pacifica]MCO6374711.1 glycosyltransferase [Roseivirga pacifica]MCO6379969.1 glycosyltransferase [Roseivirga pacifica]